MCSFNFFLLMSDCMNESLLFYAFTRNEFFMVAEAFRSQKTDNYVFFCYRCQRDQLAAIFQLLRDKQETFGDVSESDLEEQLKLYSI